MVKNLVAYIFQVWLALMQTMLLKGLLCCKKSPTKEKLFQEGEWKKAMLKSKKT